MKLPEINNLLTDSRTPIAKRISALDELVELIKIEVDIAVQTLEINDEYRLFVAERLYKLGSIAVEPLCNLYESSDGSELQFTIAFLLLKLGDLSYVDKVIKRLNRLDKEDICLVANALAKANVLNAVDALINRLLSTDSLDEILCLIFAIDRLVAEFPQHVKLSVFSKVNQSLVKFEDQDFDTVLRSLEIVDTLGYTLDQALITKLAQNAANRNILEKFGYDVN